MSQANRNQDLAKLLRTPVVPVVTIEDAEKAVPLARALSNGGLPVIEVTLRSDAALAAIRAMASELSGRVMVGAGTVRDPSQAAMAMAAGAAFLVSPGMTPPLLEAAQGWKVPFLPGAATASEAMALADLGYGFQKFFPAEPAGGVAALKALAAPLPDIRFCPTGGITAASAPSYLACANVICIGGSWVCPPDLVAQNDWSAIEELARTAAALG